MEGFSVFDGDHLMMMITRPQRRQMGAALLRAARSGDLDAFPALLSPPSQPSDPSNNIPQTCVVISRDDNSGSIFGITAGGNTILHIAAEHGHLEFADEVCRREPAIIAAVNTSLETPLHCCAKAGHHQIVSLIIDTCCREDGGHNGSLLDVVRARNVHGETALHEASRSGSVQVVQKLMAVDVELASYVSDAGMSPLYLAVLEKSEHIVDALLQSPSSSITGPAGQTALHASVTRSESITKMLLRWNGSMTRMVDESGSVPLHYVAADGNASMARILLNHDSSTVYFSDVKGGFPIHAAASMGHVDVINELLEHCPDSYELLDFRGRSFLHVAVEKAREEVVSYVRLRKELGKLLNQRDNNGNTALHLAFSSKDPKLVVIALLWDRRVDTSIMNNQGHTPLDLSCKEQPGSRFRLGTQMMIILCLVNTAAMFSPQRLDHASYEMPEMGGMHEVIRILDVDTEKGSILLSDLLQSLAIVSVLISTVTFAAGFTMPGGYNSDDGTAVLAKKYPFKAFLISNTFGMVCSFTATMRIMFGGSPIIDRRIWTQHYMWSMMLLWISFACMSLAFSMATYVVVVPKAWGLGLLVCVITLFAPIATMTTILWPYVSLQRMVRARNGPKGIYQRSKNWKLLWDIRIHFLSVIFNNFVFLFVYLLVFLLALV